MTSTLALANLLFFLQAGTARPAPAPSTTSPTPAAAAPTSPTPAAPPPARPTVPVLPHSPKDAASFLHVFHLEQELAKESENYFKSAQDHLNQDKAKMDGLNLLLADEMKDLRAKESWGPEVLFNPQTEKFEKPLPGSQPAAAPAPSPAAAPEKKP